MPIQIRRLGSLYFEANRWRQDWEAVDDAGQVVNANRASFGDPRKPDQKTPPDKATVDAAFAGILGWVAEEIANAQQQAVADAAKAAYLKRMGLTTEAELVKVCVEKNVDVAAAVAKEER